MAKRIPAKRSRAGKVWVLILLYYKIDVMAELRRVGYTTYRLRREHIFSEHTLQRVREGQVGGAEIIDRLCNLLGRQPGDLIGYIPADSTKC